MGVDGYVLVFSISSRQSFDRISQINDSLENALGDVIDIPRVLVGSMCDLAESRQVSEKVSVQRALFSQKHTQKSRQEIYDFFSFQFWEHFDSIGCNGSGFSMGYPIP